MISDYAERTVNWLIQQRVVKKEDKELYEYAIYNIVLTAYPIGITIIMGILMGVLKESMVTVLTFMLIRKFSGGFHARKPEICMIVSALLIFLCIKCIIFLNFSTGLLGVTLLAAVALLWFSPVDSENRRLEEGERLSNKRRTTVIILLLGVIAMLLYFSNQQQYVVCISVAIIWAFGMQLPCILFV